MRIPFILAKVLSLLTVLALSSCTGTYQARSVDLENTVLVNPRILKKGSDDQALYRYVNPNANFSRYNKVLIAPILISKAVEAEPDDKEDYESLAHNAHAYLAQELQKHFTLVKSPSPGTMKIQMAIVEADSSKPIRTLLSITPIGMGMNLVKLAATGKKAGVGEITAEFVISDAVTKQVLGAAVDRQVGNKNPSTMFNIWANANSGLEYWAKKLTYALCEEKGIKDCVNPD